MSIDDSKFSHRRRFSVGPLLVILPPSCRRLAPASFFLQATGEARNAANGVAADKGMQAKPDQRVARGIAPR